MLDIYLCEDNPKQLSHWKDLVKKYILMNDDECRLLCAVTTPDELLNIRSQASNVGLYFLDIDLESSMNGLELAQEIRKSDSRGYIVFITTHSEMNVLTFRYKIEAMDFILKDEPDTLADKLHDCIRTAITNQNRHLKNTNDFLSIKSGGDTRILNQNDIVYISLSDMPRKVTIVLSYGVYQANGSLTEFSGYLSPSFFQCSRSTIVNLNHLTEYRDSARDLLLDNGETIQVSLRMVGALKKLLKNKEFSI